VQKNPHWIFIVYDVLGKILLRYWGWRFSLSNSEIRHYGTHHSKTIFLHSKCFSQSAATSILLSDEVAVRSHFLVAHEGRAKGSSHSQRFHGTFPQALLCGVLSLAVGEVNLVPCFSARGGALGGRGGGEGGRSAPHRWGPARRCDCCWGSDALKLLVSSLSVSLTCPVVFRPSLPRPENNQQRLQ